MQGVSLLFVIPFFQGAAPVAAVPRGPVLSGVA